MLKRQLHLYSYRYLLAVLAALFLCEIAPIVFTVHDDITTYAIVKRGLLWDSAADAALSGSLSQFLSTILLGLPMLQGSMGVYKLFSYSTLLFDTFIFYILAQKVYGKPAAILSIGLFWGFSTITNQHNLFVSYVLGRQLIIGVILLSVWLFLRYYETRKAAFLWGSSILYLFACMVYEAAVPFWLLFLMIGMALGDGGFKTKIGPSLLPGILAAIYIFIYFAWQSQHPTSYEGRQFYLASPLRSLWSVFMYSLGSFPLYSLVIALLKNDVGIRDISLPALPMISAIITSALWYRYLPQISLVSGKKARWNLAITGAGIFLPNLLIGFTPKYMEWNSYGCFTYLTTFYSYFFLLVFAVMASAIIYRHVPKKRVFLTGTTAAVFLIGGIAVFNNRLWKEEFAHDMVKYRAFDQAVSSPEFLSYEDGTNVYIPDFMGINQSMEQTQNYSKIYTDKNFIFTNEREALDYTKKVIQLEYNAGTGAICIRELN